MLHCAGSPQPTVKITRSALCATQEHNILAAFSTSLRQVSPLLEKIIELTQIWFCNYRQLWLQISLYWSTKAITSRLPINHHDMGLHVKGAPTNWSATCKPDCRILLPSAPEQVYADPSIRCTAISDSSWNEDSVVERGVLPLRFSALSTCCIMESSAQPTYPSPRPRNRTVK